MMCYLNPQGPGRPHPFETRARAGGCANHDRVRALLRMRAEEASPAASIGLGLRSIAAQARTLASTNTIALRCVSKHEAGGRRLARETKAPALPNTEHAQSGAPASHQPPIQ